MILIRTHNGNRPNGTAIREFTTNCRPINRTVKHLRWNSGPQLIKTLVIKFNCGKCLAYERVK
jgi:hypothetical protein